MAEIPGEGRRGPPPLPQHAGPQAVPTAIAPEDSTTTREMAPTGGPSTMAESNPLLEMVTLIAREADAEKDANLKADLRVRVALLTWDLGDEQTSLQHARRATDHPLGSRLLYQHALSQPSAEELAGAETGARALPRGPRRDALLIDLAEAWLYRIGDPARAVALLREVVVSGGPDSAAARDTLPLALAAAGEWPDLAQLLRELPPGAKTQEAVARHDLLEGAHVSADRLADASAAAHLLQRARGDVEALPQNEHPPALERLVELASGDAPPGVDLGALLRRRLDVLAAWEQELFNERDDLERTQSRVAPPGAATRIEIQLERAATTFLYAEHLERHGQAADAGSLLVPLSSADDKGQDQRWGARLALHVRRRAATTRGAWDEAAAAYRELAGASRRLPALSRAYLRRAAEILDARVPNASERAAAAYAELWSADPADLGVCRALERLRLAVAGKQDLAALAAQLEASSTGRSREARAALLRRAAAVAERLGDVDTALRLRRESLAGADDPGTQEEIARLLRKQGDASRLAGVYRSLAQAAGEDRTASAYLCAAGMMDFLAGEQRPAEDALREALKRAPGDVFARLGLAAILRRSNRWRELAELLEQLAPRVTNDALRAACLRELGRITATRLGDPRGARAHLERALSLAPNDSSILEALSELVAETGDWDTAVALRERAVATADPARAARLLIEIGDIEERQRKDDDAARAAYERALTLDGDSLDALKALAALHRKAKRPGELLKVLRRELELTEDPQRRLGLHLEVARNTDQTEGDGQAALENYQAALAIDPANSPALAGLERICRRDGRWELLVTSLRVAPRSPRNVKTLAEGLEKLERWPELADVRRQEMEITAPDRKEAVRAALSLAQLHEEKLGDVESAIRVYRRSIELEPGELRAHRALERLFEQTERWPELLEQLEAELALLPPPASNTGPDPRRILILSRIGELRRDKLDRPAEAASAFELLLQLDPRHAPAMTALEGIYTSLGRDDDLLRVIEFKAQAEDGPQRAEHYARIAELREKRGELDEALAAFRNAFLADPSSRNTFTAYERLCYKREKWREAMELYDTAIAMVEGGKSRAYRLADLYTRRGQVQLQYLGQPGEAASSYLKAIELDPDNDTSVRFLESIFSQQQDWKNLIAAYEKRADLTSDDEKRIETLRRAARVAATKTKDAEDAARLYERILEIEPNDSEALDTLERYYDKNKEHAKLVSVLTMRLSSATAGDAAVGLLMRIANLCEEGLRDEGRAIDHYRRVLEIAPGSKEALDALGRIYESTEKWAEFVDVTRRQIRITTDRNMKALLYFKCGSVMESKFAKEDEAIRYYDAAIKTSPSCLPAVHGLRDLYLRKKDWQKVIQSLELEVKLWQDDKERAGVFAQIGHIHGDFLGDPERALHYYESALAVDPDCLPANRALFELHFDRGDWNKAAPLGQALAQKAMREGDPAERSEFYRKRGVVAWHAGDLRSAAESFIIGLEIKPENLKCLDELGKLSRAEPEAYDFSATYRELEKIYRKRDDSQPHLARVLVAQAGMVERTGDLDAAEKVYREALALVPNDFTVLSALVELHVNVRRYDAAADTIVQFLDSKAPPGARAPREVRVPALLRLAEIHADCEMDPHRAAKVLQEVLRFDPTNQEALYRMSQELYLIGRYPEARQGIEKVIELAAAPGTNPQAENLARYYYYLGRICEAMGDTRGAGSQYRRAAEYDPGYAPTALALAKRSVAGGDRRAAETTLIQAAHAAMEHGGQRAAVPLQRGLARILLAAGERQAAIEAYRGILAVEPDSSDDRVALAEVYAMEDIPKAIVEVHRVLERDLRHAPGYRLLANLYDRMGDAERAMRVNNILEMVGYAEEGERSLFAEARARWAFEPRRSPLPEDLRQALLVPPAARSVLNEVYQTVAVEVAQLYLVPPLGSNLVPVAQLDDPALKVAVADTLRLFGPWAPVAGGSPGSGEVEVYVGDDVHGGMIALQFPRPVISLSRLLLGRPDAERRFLLGRACESLRGGYAPLLRLGPRERAEVGQLLRTLLLAEHDRPVQTQEFVRSLSRRAQKALERFAMPGMMPPVVDPHAWLVGLAQAQDRGGLLACDDFAAAARMLALLSNEELAMTNDGAVALGAVPGGIELVRYFLSDDYHRLRTGLGEPAHPMHPTHPPATPRPFQA